MVFSKDEMERYTRHFVLQDVGVAGQKKIKAGSVLVVGAGGLGSPALFYLAAAGVGKIGIIDGDQVQISNLQRQILHDTNRVGWNKAQSAKQAILKLNPNVEVVVYEELFQPEIAQTLVSQYDIVLDGVDNFETKFLINDACVLEQKPFVHGGILGWQGQIFTCIPGETCCYRCIYEAVPKGENIPNCSQAGVIGALPGIIGSMQALEVLRYLLGLEPLYAGKMYVFDGSSGVSRVIPFPNTAPHCKICGEQPEIHSVIENRTEYERTRDWKTHTSCTYEKK
ncbi:MAG: HesA/MoeB/ThiF family protein [Lachnospiraceae bacterium]|nr:HesA/MoeB/ThiF family protein [Lachnospiraceae bacterium]